MFVCLYYYDLYGPGFTLHALMCLVGIIMSFVHAQCLYSLSIALNVEAIYALLFIPISHL